jgi:hypothetical protein
MTPMSRKVLAGVPGFRPASELPRDRSSPEFEQCFTCREPIRTSGGSVGYFRDRTGRPICRRCVRREIAAVLHLQFVSPAGEGYRP